MLFEKGNKRARKLTLTLVQEMRRYYGEGATQGALSRHYGVSVVQVGRIVRGESWVEGAGMRDMTQEETDGMALRLLAAQKQHSAAVAGDGAAMMADDFGALLDEKTMPFVKPTVSDLPLTEEEIAELSEADKIAYSFGAHPSTLRAKKNG